MAQPGAAVSERSLAGLGVGCRLGSEEGNFGWEVSWDRVWGSGVGGVAAVSLALEDHLHYRFRLSTELLRGHRQHGRLLAWGWPLALVPL